METDLGSKSFNEACCWTSYLSATGQKLNKFLAGQNNFFIIVEIQEDKDHSGKTMFLVIIEVYVCMQSCMNSYRGLGL